MHPTTQRLLVAIRACHAVRNTRKYPKRASVADDAEDAWAAAGCPDADADATSDPVEQALADLAGKLGPDVVVFRHAGGGDITATQMVDMLAHRDPAALDFVRDVYAAALGLVRARVGRAIAADPAALDRAAATTPEAYRGVVADAVAEELERLRADVAFWKSASDTHAYDVAATANFIVRSRDELDGLRRNVERLERERDAARAELGRIAQRLGERDAELRIAREEADHWRTVAEELAARPRLRERVWRLVGGAL